MPDFTVHKRPSGDFEVEPIPERDEFELALRRWGWMYGERPDVELPESAKTPAVHPIARAMEFGHRTMDRRTSAAFQRKARPGEKLWSRDPIPCAETRSGASTAPVAPPQTDTATVIQTAWLSLKRMDQALAEVLRLEYQVRDHQAEKAKRFGVGRGKFRELVAEAKGRLFVLAEIAKAA